MLARGWGDEAESKKCPTCRGSTSRSRSAPCAQCGVTVDGDLAVARKSETHSARGAAPATVPSRMASRLGEGRALDAGVRSPMERSFGRSFRDVRVHTGGDAASLASGMAARAFTFGSDVVFGRDQYRPGTVEGDLLLAHELAHVAQVGANQASPHGARESADLEADADAAAVTIVAGGGQYTVRGGRGLGIRRCTYSGGGISPSAFHFERITSESPHVQAACVNITISHLGAAPRISACQFEVSFPEVHHRGRTFVGQAQSAAAEAMNECAHSLIRRRAYNSPLFCRTAAACVQRTMVRNGIVGARVNTPCITSALPVTEWPTRH